LVDDLDGNQDERHHKNDCYEDREQQGCEVFMAFEEAHGTLVKRLHHESGEEPQQDRAQEKAYREQKEN